MAIEKTGGWTSSLIERAKALFTRPEEAWAEIDRDMTPSGELFTRYAAPLAALAPIAGLITGHVFGWSPFGFNIVGQLFTAVGGYAFSMVNLLVMSFIASKLAPRFGGEGSPRDAFKLIVYSSTAAWIASAVAMFPGLGFVGLASFFSLYLYFTGIGPIMKVPEAGKRRFGFVTIICAIFLNMVSMTVANTPTWVMGGGAERPHRPWVNRDDFGFDASELRQFGIRMRQSFRDPNLKVIPADDLQALLPAKIGSFERTGIESASASSSGPGGSHATATYEDGDQSFTLKLVDLARFGAMAQMGKAFSIDKNRQDEDGFEHVTTRDGTILVEKWDNDDHEGRYMTIVDQRFMIEAKGEADSFDELKRAATGVDQAKLKALEK